MCSVNGIDDVDDNDQCMKEKPSSIALGPGTLCKKCKEKTAEVVLRVRDAYCRECFLLSCVHKFRSILGRSRLVRPKEQVLIAFSGNQSSVALLHLIHEGLSLVANHKRLLFHPSVIYIDEGAILGQSKDERHIICASIVKSIKQYDFPAYIVTLDKSLVDSSDIGQVHPVDAGTTSLVNIDDEQDTKLQNVVSATGSLTSKEDLVQILRNKLLVTVAKQLKCSKIFVADVGTSLAIKLLSNISLGRGAQVPISIGFCDSRDPEVTILRPMRDFMMKEVVFYNLFHKLENVFIPSLGTKCKSDASIQKLTEKFIVDLQNDFPGTVSAVFRTGDKLSMASNSVPLEELCALCQAPLDTANMESSALQATEFSRMISTLGPAGFDTKSIGNVPKIVNKESVTGGAARAHCGGAGGDCGCSKSEKSDCRTTWADAEEFFCYGCRLISREMDESSAHLPSAVMRTVKERFMHIQMRKEIQDFLL